MAVGNRPAARRGSGIVLLVLGAQLALTPPPIAGEVAAPLTWQQANARSAEIIRDKGPNREAADLAQQAFDLYPGQTKKYASTIHAQLLLNLVDARNKGQGLRPALNSADAGLEVLRKTAGAKDPVLFDVLIEAIRVCRVHQQWNKADAYYEQALDLGEALWGPTDSRVVNGYMTWIGDRWGNRGFGWAHRTAASALERARQIAPDSGAVARLELTLVKVELEDRYRQGLSSAERLISRLEGLKDADNRRVLRMAYSELEWRYRWNGNNDAAEGVRRRREMAVGPQPESLVPLERTPPLYPRDAIQKGIGGFVLFLIDIDEKGAVTDVAILNSRPSGVFEENAMAAVRQWKFKPDMVDGKPAPTQGLQMIEFRMER